MVQQRSCGPAVPSPALTSLLPLPGGSGGGRGTGPATGGVLSPVQVCHNGKAVKYPFCAPQGHMGPRPPSRPRHLSRPSYPPSPLRPRRAPGPGGEGAGDRTPPQWVLILLSPVQARDNGKSLPSLLSPFLLPSPEGPRERGGGEGEGGGGQDLNIIVPCPSL